MPKSKIMQLVSAEPGWYAIYMGDDAPLALYVRVACWGLKEKEGPEGPYQYGCGFTAGNLGLEECEDNSNFNGYEFCPQLQNGEQMMDLTTSTRILG